MGNQMFKALEEAGFNKNTPNKKPKKKTQMKKMKCRRCNSEMTPIDDTNIFVCSNNKCNNFYVFK